MADKLQNFMFDNTEVLYKPDYHLISTNSSSELVLENRSTATVTPSTDLFVTLDAKMSDDGVLTSGVFHVWDKLASGSFTERLTGVLRAIQPQGTGFSFLVDNGSVRGDLLGDYEKLGMSVPVLRVSGVDGTGLVSTYSGLGMSAVAAQSSVVSESLTPSIPAPATILLFLIGGVSLIARRRRY
jgi:hypothetical protein